MRVHVYLRCVCVYTYIADTENRRKERANQRRRATCFGPATARSRRVVVGPGGYAFVY